MTIGDDCVVERIRIEREAARGDWPALLLDVCLLARSIGCAVSDTGFFKQMLVHLLICCMTV